MNLNAQFGRHIYEGEGIHVQVFKLFDLDIFRSGVLVVNHVFLELNPKLKLILTKEDRGS